MQNKRIAEGFRLLMAGLLLVLSCCVVTAQDIATGAVKSRLATAKVHLSLGNTTLSKALASLSTQISLAIIAAPSLSNHKLVMSIEEITAEHALDALCELNDWIWTIDVKGQIVVDRPKVLKPRNLTELHTAFWTALPVAYRNFVSTDLKPTDANARIADLYADPMTNSIQLGQGTKNDELKLFFHAKGFTVKDRTDYLSAALLPLLTNGKRLEYSELAPDQKQALTTAVVVAAMGNLKSLGFVWRAGYKPFEFDPMLTMIKLVNGNEIQFDNEYVDDAGRHGIIIGGRIKIDE